MMKSYELIRVKDSKTIFTAAYAKHFLNGDFCALMEEYPSENTRVLVCRKEEGTERDYGYLLNRLVSHGVGGEKNIGNYVSMGEVRSEQEAENRIAASISSNAALHQLIQKK